MKKLLFTIISSTLIASTCYGKISVVKPLTLKDFIKEVKLFDGRKIDYSKSVERLHTFDNAIDFLELYSGEIVDRTDIQSIQYLHADKMMMARTGVDGGG